MIQDIYPHKYDNTFTFSHEAGEEAPVLLYTAEGLLCLETDPKEIILPRAKELPEDLRQELHFFFRIDDEACYGLFRLLDQALPGMKARKMFSLREARPKFRAFAGVTGWQLTCWYRDTSFCGRCGHPMLEDHIERKRTCPHCGYEIYPKISPAVIIAVTHGNRLLLSKYAGREYTRYALLAGFSELGETIEETVHREVMEEVGLKVKNLRFYKSQPWSFSDTLLMGFYCDLDGDLEDITLDEQELSMAGWFEREELDIREDDCSLTNEMIIHFMKGNM